MTVQDLIDRLMKIENKELPIFVYDTEEGEVREIMEDEDMIDESILDRVDINIY